MTQRVKNKVRCGKFIYNDEMLGVVVVVSSVLALAATSSVNYCGAKMCGNTNAHTFCQYPNGPSAKCQGYIRARLHTHEKKRLLARLNGYRQNAAMGTMIGFPPATNMLRLRWVEELALEAQRWADQCRPPRRVEEHDTCRDLYSVTVGQCVASVMGNKLTRVEQFVDIWYIQSVFYKNGVRYYVPPSNNSRYYGDFAQIFWAKSYMVGCGRSRFMAPWQGRLQRVERLVCNIAPYGPQPTHSLWTPGAPATACPYRAKVSYRVDGLCDYSESGLSLRNALNMRERDLGSKKRKRKRKVRHRKVRRELPYYRDEEATTNRNRWIPTTEAKSIHPLLSLIKLIPSMADYPENFPKEVIDIANTASRVSSSLVIVLVLFL